MGEVSEGRVPPAPSELAVERGVAETSPVALFEELRARFAARREALGRGDAARELSVAITELESAQFRYYRAVALERGKDVLVGDPES